ncbi:LLM class flavin-dependent oxidoreductase [Propionibacteriaceae bacterium Y2011]
MGDLRLSVLDLVPVRTGQTTAGAVAASIELARAADAAGFTRYWVAEHHNMPAVAATNPPVLIGMLAAATQRIRLGSGGVMLPNHAPLVVAEQFALLEAAYPGRIDLGLGRAPGSDPVTTHLLRHGGPTDEKDVMKFDQHVQDLMAMMSAGGVEVNVGGRGYELHATPYATSEPRVWLLGSSDYSARLAAQLGLPYVFAHHFAGRGTAEALALYRGGFTPSEHADRPTTLLTVNAIVADTDAEAERLALPYRLMMMELRTGDTRRPIRTVEEAEAVPASPERDEFLAGLSNTWVVGSPDTVGDQLRALAGEFDVDEVMLHPVAGSYADDDPARSPARQRTLELLADFLG